ncbi:hypothetical protein LTS15_010708 [Exophiala xenobiotica]|nr:hypothetical protein LTS15_010708 [Exophiala xenobiotica]
MCFQHSTYYVCPRCETRMYDGPSRRERCPQAQLSRRDCTFLEPGSDRPLGAADLCDVCFNVEQNNLRRHEAQSQPRRNNGAGGRQPPSDISDDLPLPPDRPVRPLDEDDYHPHQRQGPRGREREQVPRPRPRDHRGEEYDAETISLEALSIGDPHERPHERSRERESGRRFNDNNHRSGRHQRDDREWDQRRNNPHVVESTWRPSNNHHNHGGRRASTDSQPPSYSASTSNWTGRSREAYGPFGLIRTRDEDGYVEVSSPFLRPGAKVKKDESGRLVQERRKR